MDEMENKKNLFRLQELRPIDDEFMWCLGEPDKIPERNAGRSEGNECHSGRNL